MPDVFLASSYGGLPLFISKLETKDGRDIVVQRPNRGDRHYSQDQGTQVGEVDCEILFVTEPGKAPFVDRFKELRELINKGEPQIFTHPLLGSYRARFGNFHHSLDMKVRISCKCSVIPEDEPQPVTPAGSGAGPIAAAAAVTAAANTADTELAAIGASNSAPAEARDLFDRLSDLGDKLDPQVVLVGIGTLNNLIDQAIELHDLAGAPERWQAYKAMVGLQGAVNRASEVMDADSNRLTTALFNKPRSLRSFCAELYGGDQAIEMADRVAKLNRVRTPARIPAGTILTIPAPRAA